jgi:hypothetical protein
LDDKNINQVSFLLFFNRLFGAIRSHIVPLSIFNLIILGSGITYRMVTDLSYEGSVLVKSNYVEFNYVESIIAPLNRHIKDRKKQTLVNSLGLTSEIAENCGKMTVSTVIDEEYASKRKFVQEEYLGEYEKDIAFILTISSGRKSDLPMIKESVLSYLRNQPYIKKRENFFAEQRIFLSGQLRKDIQAMDSMKHMYDQLKIGPDSDFKGLIVQDLGDFFFGGSKVYEEYLKVKYLSVFKDSFEEITNFEVYEKYASPRWTNVLVISALVGIVISGLFLFVSAALRVQQEQ